MEWIFYPVAVDKKKIKWKKNHVHITYARQPYIWVSVQKKKLIMHCMRRTSVGWLSSSSLSSFRFTLFAFNYFGFFLVSFQSVPLNCECVSAGLRLTFENVEWILLSSKMLDIGPVVDTWQWAESASYTEIRWKKTCPSANAHVRVMCSFIWCDAIRAFDIRAIRNVNECKANEWNTPTGNCVQRQRRSWLRLNEFHCEHMFGHRHNTIHSLLDSGK